MRLFPILAVLLLACGGVPHPRISQVEVVHEGSGALSIELTSYTYSSDGNLKTIDVSVDGELQRSTAVTYSGDRLTGFVTGEVGTSSTTTGTVTYAGDIPESLELVRQIGSQVETTTHTYAYEDDLLTTETIVAVNSLGSVTTAKTYTYNDDQHLQRITVQTGGTSSLVEFTYDEDNTDKLTHVVRKIGSDTNIAYAYDEDDRLQQVSVSNAGGSTSDGVKYNSDDLISEIARALGGSAKDTIRYTYGDGDVQGLLPTAKVEYGELFSLDGYPLDEVGATYDGWRLY